MIGIRLRTIGLLLVASACGGQARESRSGSNAVGGTESYMGAEPTQIPTDLRPDGPTPPPNGQPMKPRSDEAPTNSSVSLSGVQPNLNNGGAYSGVGGTSVGGRAAGGTPPYGMH